MIDGTVDKGILKYRSMIAKISVAYADLEPEVKITLRLSLDHNALRGPAAHLTRIASLILNFPGFSSKPMNLVPRCRTRSFASR